MKVLTKIKEAFSTKTTDVKYFVMDVTPRAVYENSNRGGVRITVKFQKTITRFGRSKVLSDVVTFNNYHTREKNALGERLFTYNPQYVPREDAHIEDSLWHSIMVWDNCEDYPFAPITTHQLNLWIDEWAMKNVCFSCPCGHKQCSLKDKQVVVCPSCGEKVGVPQDGEPAFID